MPPWRWRSPVIGAAVRDRQAGAKGNARLELLAPLFEPVAGYRHHARTVVAATGLLLDPRCAPTGRRKQFEMTDFTSFSELRAVCLDLPSGHRRPARRSPSARRRSPSRRGSLGRLEEIVAWLAHWQGHAPPRLERIEILVFAGNHGVTTQGVSAYPAEVTAQMVANFAAGGAAINQLARTSRAPHCASFRSRSTGRPRTSPQAPAHGEANSSPR